MSELRNLKSRIDELEGDLRERDDEVKALKQQDHAMANGAGGDDAETVKVRRDGRCVGLFFFWYPSLARFG